MIILGAIFVILKLTHLVDWEWPIVTIPFWGPWVWHRVTRNYHSAGN